MTRVLTCGWETGDVAEAGASTIGTNMALSVVSSTPTPRGATYCLKAGLSSGGTIAPTYKGFATGTLSEIWVRFAFYAHGLSGENAIAQLLESAAAVQTTLTYSSADGLLRAYRATSTALLGAASASFGQDSWHLIEWRSQFLTTTTGTTEVWLDGTRVINFSGDNSATSNLNAASVLLGLLTSLSSQTAGLYAAYDDIAVNNVSGTLNNGRPGDGRVVLLTPTGAGSNTGLSRGGTDSGANWSQTEELPPSMTDYVFGATAALRDTYALSDLAGVSSVNVAEVLVLAQNSDAGAGSLGLTVKSGATTNEGTAQALGTTAAYIRQQYETDPATSAAWTSSAINALEAGVTVR